MDPNQFLVSWLRAQSVVDDAVLTQAMRIQFQNPKQHLFQVLVQLGAFTEAQGRHYYSLATQAYQSQSFQRSNDSASDVTLRPGFETTHTNPSTGRPLRPASSKSASQSSGSFAIPVFEKYEIDGEISRGGMGVVFRARYKESSLEVALKVILDQSPPEEEIKRFRREAQTLAQIQHPGVVRIRDFGESEGRPYFAMDLIQGQPLKKAIDDQLRETGKVPAFTWTVKVFSEIAAALVHCHDLNIIHRDLKPANILLDGETEQPVIVDFGLVKRNVGAANAELESIDNLTNSQATLGTPAYMAPEQFDRQGVIGEVDKKSDVWGFGATLYYALTGQAPYTGETVFNIYKALLKGDPPPPSTINPEIPDELNELCSSCLTRNKSQRPTMRAIEDALRQPLSERTLKKKRSRQMTVFLWSGASFLLFGLIAAVSVTVRPQLLDFYEPVLTVNPTVPTTIEESIDISGTASDEFLSRVELRVGSRSYKIQANPSKFSKTLPLKLGMNRVVVRAYDENERFAQVNLEIRRVTPITELTLAPTPKYSYEKSLSLTGEAPPTIVNIECNGQKVVLKDKKFAVKLPLQFGLNELKFTAYDKYNQSTTKLVQCVRNEVYSVGPVRPSPLENLSSKHFTKLQDAIDTAQKSSRKKPIPKIRLLERTIRGGLKIKGRLYLEGLDREGTVIESTDKTCFSVEEGQVRLENIRLKTVITKEIGVFALRLLSGSIDASNCHFSGGYDSVRLGSEISLARADLYPSINFNSCVIEDSSGNGVYARFRGQVNLSDCVIRGHREAGLFIELTPGSNGLATDHRDSLIDGCVIEKNGLEGCEINGVGKITLRNTKIRDNTQEGILVDNGGRDAVIVENCQIDRNGKGTKAEQYPGVLARAGSQLQLKKCQLRDNFDESIYCSEKSSKIVVEDCSISGSKVGCKVAKGGQLILRECTIRDCRMYGIFIDRCKGVQVIHSIIENCKTGLNIKGVSVASIDDSSFLGNKVFGIQCKESSSLILRRCKFIKNSIGMSASDRSRVTYSQCLFKDQTNLDKKAEAPESIREVP